jgi:hypothetical protein
MDFQTKFERSEQSRPYQRGSLGEAEYCFPTTIAQQGFQYLDQLERGNPAWNIAVRFQLQGPLQIALVERALHDIVARHEVLRTTFAVIDDLPMQIVHTDAVLPLPVEDLSKLSPQEREAAEERLTIEEGSRSFDLTTGPLIRALLLRFAEDDHMLLLTVHHIVSDGWSIGILSDEIAAFYQSYLDGQNPRLPDLPFQFADFAIWQNEKRSGAPLEQHRAYWKEKLARLPLCEIPADYARPPIKTHHGYILSTLLPVPLTESLAKHVHNLGATFFTAAAAALMVLIRHYAKQDDIVMGTLLAGRDRVDLEPLVGLFINTVVLRTDLSGDPTFPELLNRVHGVFDEAVAHQDLHFQQVVETVKPKRDPSRPPLYSINFIYQRDFVKPLSFAGLTMQPYPSKSPGAIYDLNFFMVQRSDGWRLSCEYNCDLYDGRTVNLLLGQLRHLFEQIAVQPNMRVSSFSFPANVGEPLPPFLPEPKPQKAQTNSSNGAAKQPGMIGAFKPTLT